jgi:hypothetical protein|tara:strand:- start:36307 stop:36537 length:231 start_codon:yes stop_codon:yes gene_type:complete
MTNDELVTTIKILVSEIEVQKLRIQPHDTGHIHTTIGVLEDRVEELLNEVKTGVNMFSSSTYVGVENGKYVGVKDV